jgi:peptidoglycan/LPS O-acetylase OafA/YrhL
MRMSRGSLLKLAPAAAGAPVVARAPGAPAAAASTVRHIPSLDGIRAGSFLIVFGSHAWSGYLIPGGLGVTVFFFLSGFLITTLMRAEHENNGGVSLGHFYLRRALRILPPLYLVMLGAALLARAMYPPGTVNGRALAAQLLFYANYDRHPEIPGTNVVWSLAVEEHFYLLFPLLYVALQRYHISRKHQAWLLWGLCAAVLAWRWVLVTLMHSSSGRVFVATDTRIDSILFGCALAVWSNPVLDKPTLSPNLLKYLLLPLALVMLLTSAYVGNIVFAETWSFTVEGAALTLLFIGAVRFYEWPPFRILNYRPVVLIGLLSYSLYLVHDVLLQALTRVWKPHHGSLRGVVVLSFSIITAWAIYQAVEKPCARLRKRLSDLPFNPVFGGSARHS